MKKRFLHLGSLALSLLMLLSLGACKKTPQESEPTTTVQESYKPASEFGITEYGLIPESALPNHGELKEWFETSQARSSLDYAVFYAKEETSNIWYCWMYAASFTYADTATLSVDDTNGTRVQIALTLQNEDAITPGAICFALPSSTEPTFSLTVGGDPDGLIVTLSDSPAIPLNP